MDHQDIKKIHELDQFASAVRDTLKSKKLKGKIEIVNNSVKITMKKIMSEEEMGSIIEEAYDLLRK